MFNRMREPSANEARLPIEATGSDSQSGTAVPLPPFLASAAWETAASAEVEIIIPVFNQLTYTRDCLDSLRRTTKIPLSIVIVDNGSSDGTPGFLAELPEVTVIRNHRNLGCAAAWNQGLKTGRADWAMFLNNDVLLTTGWLEGLLSAAEEMKLDIVSPAMREGLLNYELESYARAFVQKAARALRPDVADGVCFMVRRRVFDAIGLFDENFRVGVFEDTDFFHRARKAGFRLGTTGRSFIHHFGSVTQKLLRQNQVFGPYEQEARAYFHHKWKLNRFQRWAGRLRNRVRNAWWSARERRLYGHSLHESWRRGRLVSN